MQCRVCGGTKFSGRPVLWPQLIQDWQLSPEEAAYVDRQQGECCEQCGANLRSVALARAICDVMGHNGLLLELARSPRAQQLRVLELNGAGSLTPVLRLFGQHVYARYPEVDIHAMPYESGTFDLVVHSDTLEHVPNPVHALTECRRVLKPGGALCYTVPTIVARMTRTRDGLPKSYHGKASTSGDDYAVQTEYGADAWVQPIQAGFTDIGMHAFEFPAGLAISARVRA